MKNLPAAHLSFPFARNAEITIKRKKRVIKIQAELATSEIEIFQYATVPQKTSKSHWFYFLTTLRFRVLRFRTIRLQLSKF